MAVTHLKVINNVNIGRGRSRGRRQRRASRELQYLKVYEALKDQEGKAVMGSVLSADLDMDMASIASAVANIEKNGCLVLHLPYNLAGRRHVSYLINPKEKLNRFSEEWAGKWLAPGKKRKKKVEEVVKEPAPLVEIPPFIEPIIQSIPVGLRGNRNVIKLLTVFEDTLLAMGVAAENLKLALQEETPKEEVTA